MKLFLSIENSFHFHFSPWKLEKTQKCSVSLLLIGHFSFNQIIFSDNHVFSFFLVFLVSVLMALCGKSRTTVGFRLELMLEKFSIYRLEMSENHQQRMTVKKKTWDRNQRILQKVPVSRNQLQRWLDFNQQEKTKELKMKMKKQRQIVMRKLKMIVVQNPVGFLFRCSCTCRDLQNPLVVLQNKRQSKKRKRYSIPGLFFWKFNSQKNYFSVSKLNEMFIEKQKEEEESFRRGTFSKSTRIKSDNK